MAWKYKDFEYEDYKKKEDFKYDDYVAPDKFEYDKFEKGEDFNYDKFTHNDYAESDAVKQAQTNLNAHLSSKPGAYQSQWQSQLDALMGQIMNRDKFSYNMNEDALYQQYKDKYIQQGKLAMADTMGQASAMTGGYGSSYAQSVGQQAYQGQLNNLNDILPELYQMALDKYTREGQDLYNQYGMVADRENTDYGRYRDTVSDYLTERDYLTGRYDSERDYDYSKYVNNRDFAYGQYSDDRNLDYEKYINDLNFRYNQYAEDRNLAYNQYESDRAFGYDQYINDKNFEYGKWADERDFDYSKYIADRNLAYDEYSTDKNLSYEEYRAGIADDQWEKQYNESVRQHDNQVILQNQQLQLDAEKFKYQKEQDALAAGGTEEPKPETVQPTATENTTAFIENLMTPTEFMQRGGTSKTPSLQGGGGRNYAEYKTYIAAELEKAWDSLSDAERAYLINYYKL